MKCLFCFLSLYFMCTIAIARTINWYVDGSVYHTTTCESGENVTPPTAPEKYGYTFQGWELEYVSIEYIEGQNNVQYIDTDIIPNSTMSIYTKLSTSLSGDYWAALGARDGHHDGVDIFIGNNSIMIDWFGTDEDTRYKMNPGTVIQSDIFEIIINNNIAKVIKNQLELESHMFSPVAEAKYTIFLNGINDKSVPHYRKHSTGRIYRFKIDGIADMWPVYRLSDGAVGMYDTVRNRFFANAGTGSFIAGPIIGE